VVRRLFIYDRVRRRHSGYFWLCFDAAFPPAELPIRLPLLNFRALGSAVEVVYIQQWTNLREKEIA